ncbi:MAG: hypothetical protein ACE5FL_13420 [Myxococcota bacterium]
MPRRALVALLILASSPVLAASSSDWSFLVLEVAAEPPGHRIRLRPVPPGHTFPRSCRTFVVHTLYDLDGWSPAGRSGATHENHERSIRALVQAQITGEIVRFGSIGVGFAAIVDGDTCEVASHGLTYVVTPSGSGAVYSVFEEP